MLERAFNLTIESVGIVMEDQTINVLIQAKVKWYVFI